MLSRHARIFTCCAGAWLCAETPAAGESLHRQVAFMVSIQIAVQPRQSLSSQVTPILASS